MNSTAPTEMEPASKAAWTRIAIVLVAGTMAYNFLEAVVALWAGSEANSISLLGFGLDSVIEMTAAAVVLWRLKTLGGEVLPEKEDRAERIVHRFIGGTFIALALYVGAQSAWSLWSRAEPEASLAGILLAGASLAIMPLIARAKLKAARALSSASLRAEALETLACAYLSGVLLLGLGANAVLGWWWADPAAALLMVPWLAREGLEAFEEDHED